jgi:hypothetical protein
MKRTLAFISILTLAAGMTPAAALAGQAYDQITKFQQGADFASIEPGDWDAQWKTASQPAAEQPSHGGMFGKMRDAMAQAGGMMAMMQSGLAQSHYVAGAKERVDEVAMRTATITDCGARTITHLDLKAKTYYVVSMDQPAQPSKSTGRSSAPEPAATDDGTRVAMTIANKALGPKQVYGNNSSGYSTDMTIVTTRGDGSSNTNKSHMKEYVSGMPHAWLDCSARQTQPGRGMGDMINRMNDMMRALETRKDSRFTISSSGPSLPSTLPYFQAMDFSGGDGGESHGGGMVFVVERNNIRSIEANDSIFSVPADFTKVSPP